MQGRTKNVAALEEECERQAKAIFEQFKQFTEGTRYITLLHRAKEGGAGSERKRRGAFFVVHDPEEYMNALVRLLILKNVTSKPYRLYAAMNARDLTKAEKHFKENMLAVDFTDDQNKRFFYERLTQNWVGAVMVPGSRARGESYFLLDCDGEGDVTSAPLKWLEEHDAEVVMQYQTPHGWHIITKPFNPTDFKVENCEIKKDGLLLLAA